MNIDWVSLAIVTTLFFLYGRTILWMDYRKKNPVRYKCKWAGCKFKISGSKPLQNVLTKTFQDHLARHERGDLD